MSTILPDPIMRCPTILHAPIRSTGGWEIRGQTGGVHPKTETEIMVTVLDKENTCHRRKRSSLSTGGYLGGTIRRATNRRWRHDDLNKSGF